MQKKNIKGKYINFRPRIDGFTLIEIVIVIGIIAILLVLSVIGWKSVREMTRVARAKSEIGQISVEIDQLYADTKMYPGYQAVWMENGALTSINVDDKSSGLGENCAAGDDPNLCFTNWRGPYYKGTSKDPWGNNYKIVFAYLGPPSLEVQGVVLSYGPDGVVNTCDDIYKPMYSRKAVAGSEQNDMNTIANTNGVCETINKLN